MVRIKDLTEVKVRDLLREVKLWREVKDENDRCGG